MRVRFLTPARNDLLQTIQYLAETSPTLPARFLDEIREAIELISEFPRLGVPSARGTRRVPLHSFPHSLVYLVGDDVIRIIAVRHHSRDPGYWEDRV